VVAYKLLAIKKQNSLL